MPTINLTEHTVEQTYKALVTLLGTWDTQGNSQPHGITLEQRHELQVLFETLKGEALRIRPMPWEQPAQRHERRVLSEALVVEAFPPEPPDAPVPPAEPNPPTAQKTRRGDDVLLKPYDRNRFDGWLSRSEFRAVGLRLERGDLFLWTYAVAGMGVRYGRRRFHKITYKPLTDGSVTVTFALTQWGDAKVFHGPGDGKFPDTGPIIEYLKTIKK